MNTLETYLNEHLSGSRAALCLLSTLARSNPMHRAAYQRLHAEILQNRRTLESLMDQASFRRFRAQEMLAGLAAGVMVLRLKRHGMKKGKLGLVEALEALELGIQGQILLWNALTLLSPAVPEWKEVDFNALRKSAEEQRTAVEILRLEAAHAAFYDFPHDWK